MKKNLSLFLIAFMLLSSTTAFATSKFTDVKDSNWAYPYINKLVEKGGIKGYPDGTFKAQNTITAAEFVKTVVALIDGEKEPLESDSNWASGYMLAATVLEIVPEGMFEKGDWDKPISRQKMGVIMERTAELFYDEETVTDQTRLNSIIAGIKDYDSVCQYCKDYIVQAVARGLITGYSDGTFKPEKTATRAEASTMIVRLIDKSFRVTEATKSVGTVIDISNYTTSPNIINEVKIYGDKVVYVNDGSRFNLSYGTTYSSTLYTLKHNDGGNAYGIKSDKKTVLLAQHVPTNTYTEVLCEGNIKDYEYLIFDSWENDTCTKFVFPNPFL